MNTANKDEQQILTDMYDLLKESYEKNGEQIPFSKSELFKKNESRTLSKKIMRLGAKMLPRSVKDLIKRSLT